jgi:hypothetical protein
MNVLESVDPICSVSPTSLNFGLVDIGSTADLSFTISNDGGGVLSGTVSESCNPFSIVGGGGSYSLGAGESREVTVRFAPFSGGVQTCTVDTGDGTCEDVLCEGESFVASNINGVWALHYAGLHDPGTNTCDFDLPGCEAAVVDAPSGPGRYDIYIIAANVDEVAGTRFGLACDGPTMFYGWTPCSDFDVTTAGWPGCGEGTANTWSSGQAGPTVTVGILDVYVYGSTVSLSTTVDPRVGHAEWCDATEPIPQCHISTNPAFFSTMGFGVPGQISCGCNVASLLSPTDDSTCVPAEVTLDWEDLLGAGGYEVQIGTSCGTGTVYSAASSQKTVSGLDPETAYFWRVRAECDDNWGNWSGCRTFTTSPSPPGVPALSSPTNGGSDLPVSVTLFWDCVPEALGYEVRIGRGCGGGTVYSTSSCEKTVSGLETATDYCWSVRAKNECDVWGEWSDCWCFRTRGPPINGQGKWVLHFAGPHNAKANTCSYSIVDCMDIDADAPAGTGRYDVYVIAVDVDRIAGTRYGLSCDGSFFFYGWTKCSDLEIPSSDWPGCGEANAQTWSLERTGPHVTVGILDVYTYGDARSLSIDVDSRVGFAEWCDGSQPHPQCKETTNPDVFGSVGFGVPGYNPCSQVPVGLAGFSARSTVKGILLEWAAADATMFSHYYIHRSAVVRDGDYLRLHDEPVVGGTGPGEYSFLDGDVTPGTLYYYKVEAVELGGGSVLFGPYEVLASRFEAQYRLSQNVPNPFVSGSGTTIHYSVANAGRIEIRILDAAGRLVKTICDQARAGDNSVIWDGRGANGRRAPSGVYFYEIEAGGFKAERKMLLVD